MNVIAVGGNVLQENISAPTTDEESEVGLDPDADSEYFLRYTRPDTVFRLELQWKDGRITSVKGEVFVGKFFVEFR